MEIKSKVLDKKHLIIIIIAIFAIIISYFNITYAFFSTSENKNISVKSAASFGERTVIDPNVSLEGDLIYKSTDDKQNVLKNQTLSYTKDNVDEYDYELTIATQVDPHITEYEGNEYTSISYEIYHKTDTSIDTTNFVCNSNKYNNGTSEDTCNTGTFIENSLNGLPFELMRDYKITDTNTHYFDVYIYLNNETESKMFKTKIFYLEKEVEKEKVKSNPNPPEIDSTGLVPIKYNETTGKWVVTTQNDSEWYDYDNQKWANAASIKEGVITEENPYPELAVPDGTSTDSDILAMFVWIPRFSYTIGCTDVNGDGNINTEVTTASVPTECLGYKVDGASDLALETPGAIDIKFVDKDTTETYTGDSPIYTYTSESDRNPSNYYTHPAFTFGIEELTGIWVGKFETSVNPDSVCYTSMSKDNCLASDDSITPIILPNVKSLRYQTVNNQFITAGKFTLDNNKYMLNGDSHMMKNSEWGAAAYITQSIYGKYGNSNYEGINKEIYMNNNKDNYTGISLGKTSGGASSLITCRYNEYGEELVKGKGSCGGGSSTTGNIYGLYDMNGGSFENLMGNYNNKSGTSGFKFSNYDAKYYDIFTTINPFSVKTKEIIGHALYETSSWYSDNIDDFTDEFWIVRGGNYNSSDGSGIFYMAVLSGNSGGGYSFRTVLVSNE